MLYHQPEVGGRAPGPPGCGQYLRTKTLDCRGFDSSRILITRGGILMSIGNFPEGLSQGILAGIILVGRLGVRPVLISSTRRISNPGSQIPYPNTQNHVLSRSKSIVFLGSVCMQVSQQSVVLSSETVPDLALLCR